MKKTFRLPFVLIVLLAGLTPFAALAQESNLLGDPGFELSTPNGTFPDSGYWSPSWLYQAGSLCTTTASHSGNNGLWTYTGVDGSSWWVGPWQQLPVIPGYGYRGSAWARGVSWTTGARAVVRISFLDATGYAMLASFESPALAAAPSDWAQYEVVAPPTPGAAYVRLTLYLEKPSGSSGQAVMNFDDVWLSAVVLPPSVTNIMVEPQGSCVPAGSGVALTGLGSGSPPLSYQWRHGSMPVAAATESVLLIASATTNDGGVYDLVVTNIAGGSTSAPVTLIICEPLRPVLLSVSPPPNVYTAAPTSAISLVYSAPMDPAKAAPANLAVHPSMSGANTSFTAFSVSGPFVNFRGPRSFKPGELVEVSATRNLLATDGLGPTNSFVWQFRSAPQAGSGIFDLGAAALGDGGRRVVVADFNNDGHLDIAVGTGTNIVWLGDGLGHFSPTLQTFNGASGWVIAAADFNGDGWVDLLLYSSYQLQVWLNAADGSGRFVDSGVRVGSGAGFMRAAKVADLNGDGILDVVVGYEVAPNEVWLGTGAGRFVDSGQRLGSGLNRTYGLDVGDINEDGALDLVTANLDIESPSPYAAHVYLNDGNGNFGETRPGFAPGYGRAVALGDFNGDGHLDLAVGLLSQLQIYRGDGTGSFAISQSLYSWGDAWDLAVADCDHDGNLDVVAAESANVSSYGMGQLFLNDGALLRDSGHNMLAPGSYGVAVGDFDENGSLDLVFSCSYWNEVWLNQNAPPSGPQLWAERSAQGIVVKWLSEFSGFTLEQAPALNGPWNAVGGTPTSEPPYYKMVLPFQSDAGFFRLRK